jgi:hypothetical protein
MSMKRNGSIVRVLTDDRRSAEDTQCSAYFIPYVTALLRTFQSITEWMQMLEYTLRETEIH